MDIDIYQQCPCHSEKKIKFCCGKEIVADLNQVLAKNAAGQSQAALDLLERTIKRTGPKDCLLTIQTHILISHGEIEKAKAFARGRKGWPHDDSVFIEDGIMVVVLDEV